MGIMAIFESRTVVLGLRIVQALLAILVFALTVYVSNWWAHYWFAVAPSQVGFLVFAAVWTLLALAYLIVVPWRFSDTVAHHKFVILSLEGLTMLFWFAGFVALATFLSDRVCFGHVCSAAKAATVFAAFEWLVFIGTFAMAVLHVFRTRGRISEKGTADPNMNVAQGV